VLSSGTGSGRDFDTDHFRSIQSRYLCRESISGTSHILRFLAYGRQLAQNEGPRTNISWAPDYQSLTLFSSAQSRNPGSTPIHLADFRRMAAKAVLYCYRLTQEIMLGWEPYIDFGSL